MLKIFKVKYPVSSISLSNELKAFSTGVPISNYNNTKIHRQQILKEQHDVASNSVCNTSYSKLHYKLTKTYIAHIFAPAIHLSFLLERKNEENVSKKVLYMGNIQIITYIS